LRKFELHWNISGGKISLTPKGFAAYKNMNFLHGIDMPEGNYHISRLIDEGFEMRREVRTITTPEYMYDESDKCSPEDLDDPEDLDIDDLEEDIEDGAEILPSTDGSYSKSTNRTDFGLRGYTVESNNMTYSGENPMSPISSGGQYAASRNLSSLEEIDGKAVALSDEETLTINATNFVPTENARPNTLGNIYKKRDWDRNWSSDRLYSFLLMKSSNLPCKTIQKMMEVNRRIDKEFISASEMSSSSLNERLDLVNKKIEKVLSDPEPEKQNIYCSPIGRVLNFDIVENGAIDVNADEDLFYYDRRFKKSNILHEAILHMGGEESNKYLDTLLSLSGKKLSLLDLILKSAHRTIDTYNKDRKSYSKIFKDGSAEGGSVDTLKKSDEVGEVSSMILKRVLELLPKDSVAEGYHTLKMHSYPKTVFQKALVNDLIVSHVFLNQDLCKEVLFAKTATESSRILTKFCLPFINASSDIISVDRGREENINLLLEEFKRGGSPNIATVIQGFIVDGAEMYYNKLVDRIDNIDMVRVKGNLLNMYRKSAFNHRSHSQLTIEQTKKNILKKGLPLTRPYPNGPTKLPKVLDDSIMIDKVGIVEAGKELGHCIGSKIETETWLFREETVCAEVCNLTGRVVQCYDMNDKITSQSKSFVKKIEVAVLDMKRSGWFSEDSSNLKAENENITVDGVVMEAQENGGIIYRNVPETIALNIGQGEVAVLDNPGPLDYLAETRQMYFKEGLFIETFTDEDGNKETFEESIVYSTHEPYDGDKPTLSLGVLRKLTEMYDLVLNSDGSINL
jgi:hypothetical protein